MEPGQQHGGGGWVGHGASCPRQLVCVPWRQHQGLLAVQHRRELVVGDLSSRGSRGRERGRLAQRGRLANHLRNVRRIEGVLQVQRAGIDVGGVELASGHHWCGRGDSVLLVWYDADGLCDTGRRHPHVLGLQRHLEHVDGDVTCARSSCGRGRNCCRWRARVRWDICLRYEGRRQGHAVPIQHRRWNVDKGDNCCDGRRRSPTGTRPRCGTRVPWHSLVHVYGRRRQGTRRQGS